MDFLLTPSSPLLVHVAIGRPLSKNQRLFEGEVFASILAKIWEGRDCPLTPSSDGPAQNDGQGFQGHHELVYNSLGTTTYYVVHATT